MGGLRKIIFSLILSFQYAYAANSDPNREHLDQIQTHYVFYDIKYYDKKLCDYKITNRDVMSHLWSSGVAFLKNFGAKIPAEPDYLTQLPFTQSANDEIRVSGQDTASYYNQMEAYLRARHDSQDQALDNLLDDIAKSKGTHTLPQIRNLDPDAIVALKLAQERFKLTTEQIQEWLVYYDLLDDKVEKTIDQMLQGYLGPSGQLPESWVAPQNIQYMAVVEMHLDNFRGLLHDTKTLTLFLSKCYGDLQKTYLTTLVNTAAEIALEDKPKVIQNYSEVANQSYKGPFTKPEILSLDGILDAASTKYQEKLQKKTQISDKKDSSLSHMRYQIAAHSKLATENGGILLERNRDQVSTTSTASGRDAENPAVSKSADVKEVQITEVPQQIIPAPLTMTKDMVIDSKKILAEARSEEHNRAMVIDLSGKGIRMNETEYQVYRRSRNEYNRQDEDTLFTVISKAYHRIAFPIFLLPELVEARRSRP